MELDLTSLEEAVAAMEEAAVMSESVEFMGRMTTKQAELVRAGVIQHFEFTFELCWKFMRRWLLAELGSATVDGAAKRELFRLAAQYGLIDDPTRWFGYQKARNETSHTYVRFVADEVFRVALEFTPEARSFLESLKVRNG